MQQTARLPKRVMILGDAWTIYYSKRVPSWARVERGMRGVCHPSSQRIWVKPDTPERMAAVLLHELMHAVQDYASDSNNIVEAIIQSDIGEHLTSALELPMRSLIRDNDLRWVK